MTLYYEYARDVSKEHPHFVMVPTERYSDDFVQMVDWCRDQIGESTVEDLGGYWKITGESWLCYPATACFQFARETDVVAFKVRWS